MRNTMYFPHRQILRLSIFSLSILSLSAVARPTPQFRAATPDSISGLMPEVRLRKIHLVRPDLIPYPISYEIDC